MSTPHLYGATYALIFDAQGKILLGKRQNTGYYDGGWNLMAGHIEPGELASDALIREIKEECGLEVTKENIQPHHILHRLSDRPYIDISFVVTQRNGIPSITEPEKCSALERYDPHLLPEYMAPEQRHFIQAYLDGNKGFTEIDLRTA